jgi:hypothetical protein
MLCVYCVLFNKNFINRTKDLKLILTESGIEDVEDNEDQSWGEIFLTITLVPKTQEEKEQVRCLIIIFVFILIL